MTREYKQTSVRYQRTEDILSTRVPARNLFGTYLSPIVPVVERANARAPCNNNSARKVSFCSTSTF